MTIQDYLIRQARPMRQVRWVGTGVAVAVLLLLQGTPGQTAVYGAGAAAIATIVILVLIVQRRLKCPLCGHSLSTNSNDFIKGEGLEFCPHCGGRYDQPMPQTPFA